ncbi:hypothetical protein NQ317_012432 [Molorchus minor]|uniref:Uncharacterized protein n=1 Tax=Molorchus minor TaxID=1323400 RepID=A0ABQ9JWU8_9CUCU|nr:hypothetical protein NQ317_012432 [Molorchus minor]
MEIDCLGKCEERCSNLQENIEDEFVFLGARNAMLFSLESAQAVPSEDLPDDFFELTINDARQILRDVKRQRHYMDNTPLMTSTLRNLRNPRNNSTPPKNILEEDKRLIELGFVPGAMVYFGTKFPSNGKSFLEKRPTEQVYK